MVQDGSGTLQAIKILINVKNLVNNLHKYQENKCFATIKYFPEIIRENKDFEKIFQKIVAKTKNAKKRINIYCAKNFPENVIENEIFVNIFLTFVRKKCMRIKISLNYAFFAFRENNKAIFVSLLCSSYNFSVLCIWICRIRNFWPVSNLTLVRIQVIDGIFVLLKVPPRCRPKCV